MQGQETGLNASFLFVVQTLDGIKVIIFICHVRASWFSVDFKLVYQIIILGNGLLGEAFHTNVYLKWSVIHSV